MKMIFLTLALLLFGLTSAQELELDDYVSLMASDLEGVIVDCPEYIDTLTVEGEETDSSCFRFDGSEGLLRIMFSNFENSYSDVSWLTAWKGNDDGSILQRTINLAGKTLIINGIELDTYERLIAVFDYPE